MTAGRLKELNKMLYDLEKVVEMQKLFVAQLNQKVGEEPGDNDNRSAVISMIGGGNYNPEPAFWKKVREMLAEDIEQRRADLKVAFENAR